MKKGEELTLTIESLSGDGKAVARLDGFVYFVERAVPGDTVRARIWKVRKKYAEARAVNILSPSPYRVSAPCAHFGVCGGCNWQNLSYEAQLKFKQQIVINAFQRIGGFQNPDVRLPLGCENTYFYRNKMEFTFSNYPWLTEEEILKTEAIERKITLGLHVPRRYDKVLNISKCWLQSELSNRILNTLQEICQESKLSAYSTKTHEGYLRHLVIRDAKRTQEVMVNLVTTYDLPEPMQKIANFLIKEFPEITTIVNNITERKSMVALGDTEKVYHGKGYIIEKVGNYRFHISANSFFQTNTLQAEQLYAIVKEFASLNQNDIVYDLYSGTGTIAIFLSDLAKQVVGIEVAESAVEDARRNAELNQINNCFFLLGDLKDKLTKENSWLKEHPLPTVIVIDPPRSGLHPKVINQIASLSPERIVYVSCNPSTQARDVKLLTESNYQLQMIQPVDMFPHTDHIETVALLTRH